MGESRVSCTIDLTAEGKQFGVVGVPRSSNQWSDLTVPIVSVANGAGPTVVVVGGVHGDEPEGRSRRFASPASRARRRHGAADRRPVRLAGGVAGVHAALAERRQLQPLVPRRPGRPRRPAARPLHLDGSLPACRDRRRHALGGRSGLCPPWSEMHWVDDPDQRRAMVEAMLAWGTDYHFVYIDIAGTGLLVGEAERQGKVVVSTELGGGGHVTASIHRISQSGLANVLRHVGVLRGDVDERETPPAPRPGDRGRELPCWRPESGLWETLRRPRRPRHGRAAGRPDPLPRAARSRAGRRPRAERRDRLLPPRDRDDRAGRQRRRDRA